MPDVDRIILGLRVGVMADGGDEEPSIFLIDDDDLAGVTADLSGEDFITYSEEDIAVLSSNIGEEVSAQVFGSLILARDQLREAIEEADVIEMYQNQEPDWEL